MKTENVERPSFLPMNIYAGKRDYTVLTTLHSAVSSVDWEKYYNVKITVASPQLLNYGSFTGKFREQDGIEHILRTISKDHPFKFRINEEKDSIVIYE